MRNLFGAVAVTVALFSAACASNPSGEDDAADSESQATSVSEVSTYYAIRPDYRRCLAPMCGGFFVSRLNMTRTKCLDGSWQSECYVASLDMGGLGLSDKQKNGLVYPRSMTAPVSAIFRGEFARDEEASDQFQGMTFAKLTVTEAWQGHENGTMTGKTYRLNDSGIRCVTTPCPSQVAERLNSSVRRLITGLQGPLATEASQAARDFEHIMITGDTVSVGRGAKEFSVSQFFVPVVPESAPGYCTEDADCTLSAYPVHVQEERECYCGGCSDHAMTKAEAERNSKAWDSVCGGVPLPCPQPMCFGMVRAACVAHKCESVPAPY